jgi:general secretion pathway protein G
MKRKQARPQQRGFTMIELLVALVILGLMASVAGPKVYDYLTKGRTRAAKLQVQEFGPSLDLFKLEVGRYPTTQEGLQALVQQPPGVTGWNGPYLRTPSVPKDPWEHDYHYTSPGQHGPYDLSSWGGDNQEGGDSENKDVNSWDM